MIKTRNITIVTEIYYFSGTGNSFTAAKDIAEKLENISEKFIFAVCTFGGVLEIQ
jgi:hypothetical protein